MVGNRSVEEPGRPAAVFARSGERRLKGRIHREADTVRESDSLIVLGGWGIQPHEEAARQDHSAWGNILCTQRQG